MARVCVPTEQTLSSPRFHFVPLNFVAPKRTKKVFRKKYIAMSFMKDIKIISSIKKDRLVVLEKQKLKCLIFADNNLDSPYVSPVLPRRVQF